MGLGTQTHGSGNLGDPTDSSSLYNFILHFIFWAVIPWQHSVVILGFVLWGDPWWFLGEHMGCWHEKRVSGVQGKQLPV